MPVLGQPLTIKLRITRPTRGQPLGISTAAARRFLQELNMARQHGYSPSIILLTDGELPAVPPGQLEAVRRVVGELLEEGES